MAASPPQYTSSDQSSNLLSQSPNITSSSHRPSNNVNICNKSYAATLTRPSLNSNACEWNSERKRQLSAAASAARLRKRQGANGGGKTAAAARLNGTDDDVMDYDDDDEDDGREGSKKMATGRNAGGMFRNYNKSYAHRTKAAASSSAPSKDLLAPSSNNNHNQPSQKMQSGGKKRKPHPLELKLKRAAAKSSSSSPPLPKFKSPMMNEGSPTESPDSSKTTPLDPPDDHPDAPIDHDAPAKFRESYESKNAHSQKNLENIKAIARIQQSALHMGEFIGVEDEEEVEFSPLTCPASQPAWGQGYTRDEDDEEEEAENNEVGENDGNGIENEAMEDEANDIEFNVDGGEDDQEANDEEYPEGVSGLKEKYERSLKPSAMNKPTTLALDARKENNMEITKQPADATAAKRIRKNKRGGATALALAAEFNEAEEMLETSNKEEEANNDEKKKGKKRKQQGPTALALAEYDETGEIDSYFDNSKAAEERKGKLLALADYNVDDETRMDFNDDADEDPGHTSFNGNDADYDLPGTEKQSESLLGTEKQSESLVVTEKQSEPLLGTEKQSESLLSSSASQPAAESTSANNTSTNNNRTANEMIVAIRSEFDEIGRALMCPICRCTLKDAIILPCVHAFCQGCLKDYYCPRRTAEPKKKHKKKSSPTRVPKNECPVCKTANPGRRAGEEAPHLDELAKCYKGIGRAFAFAPVVHGAGIVMTQFDKESESEEEEDARKMPAQKRNSNVHEYEQHLQVAEAVHGAFLQKTESQLEHQPISRREQMENQNLVRCYQQMAREQEDVVRVDKEAFNKEVRRVGGTKQMVAAVTAKFTAEASNSRESARNDDRLGTKAAGATSSEGVKGTENNASLATNKLKKQTKAKMASAATAAASDKIEDIKTACLEVNNVETENSSSSLASKKIEATARDEAAANGITTGKTDVATKASSEEFNSLEVENAKSREDTKDESTVGEDEFCTAPDQSQYDEYSTAREESQATSSSLNVTAMASPTVIHDGNTIKKAVRAETLTRSKSSLRGANVLDLERSPESLRRATRMSMATAATGSSPIILHDGNTARKTRGHAAGRKSNPDALLKLNNYDNDPTPRRSGSMSPLPAVAVALQRAAEKNDHCPPKLGVLAAAAASIAAVERQEEEQEKQIDKGTIVIVQPRTWPGINKPGGVARVTKVHPAVDNGGNSTKYDVAYILGGKEKLVDESFVTLNEVNELSTIEEGLDDSRISRRGTMSAEKKSRSIRPRKAAVKLEPKSPAAAAAIPIYNDEELRHIPEDVLKWAGIVPKKGKRKSAQGGSASKNKATRGKKRVLTESNANQAKSKSAKMQKTAPTPTKEGGKSSQDDKSDTVEGLREVLSPLSNEDIVSLADARYSSLLSLDRKQSKLDTPLTLHAVTSSLTERDSDMLDSLCKMLKGKGVILKIMKDFNPNKTQICITAATASSLALSTKQPNEPIDVISKSRTLKVMRSALAGIPILTPQWMDACLRETHLVAPSGTMCIRTLPRKQATGTDAAREDNEDTPTEHFGVAKYAAAFQNTTLSSSNHLLSGVSVFLCGSSAGSGMTKDLKVLLQQAGASIISSVSMASRLLTDITKRGKGDPFVFLCDDSLANKTCGISDALLKQAKKLLVARDSSKTEGKETLLCVHFNWLFDSISCASLMNSAAYEPSAPRTKALWDLATESQTDRSNRKESQIY